MSRITEGTRVVVIENGELKRGVVKNTYDFSDTVIVQFDDGTTKKENAWDVAIESVAEPTENVQEPNNDRVEGAKVITKKEYMDALNFVTSPEGMLGDKVGEIDPMSVMIKGMSVMLVGMRISEKLFQDKEEIEITKDHLSDVIKEKTCPTEISNSIDGKMSVSQVLPISLLSALVLMKLINIFFDDSEND